MRATTAKSAQSRIKKLEGMETVEKPLLPPAPPRFSFTYDVPPYENVLEFDDFTLQAGEKVLLQNASLWLRRGKK